ncbi:MAG: hypothetical protein KF770_15735 [Anaerolineae bacterium]|nr:hypothetical protein [Anaerolineae bacterium]
MKRTDHTLLLVENSRLQLASLKQDLDPLGWQIIHCTDMPTALNAYDQGERSGNHIGLAAVDLGLPPSAEDPLQIGPKLIRALRQRDADLPILAYTGLSPQATPYDRLLAELLPLKVSFVYLRRMGPTFAELLDLVWQDFVILSPGPSDYLRRAVANRPDPLNDKLWETLALLAQGHNYQEIANKLEGVGVEGVRARINQIKEMLIEKEELKEYEREREDLIKWYRQHHVRFHRP